MMRALYKVVATDQAFAYVTDEHDGRSITVTNDAEAVVRAVNEEYPGRRIVYRDTYGFWDELVHREGNFIGFEGFDWTGIPLSAIHSPFSSGCSDEAGIQDLSA